MYVCKDIYEYIIEFVDMGSIMNMLSVNKKFSDNIVLIRIMKKRFPRLERFRKDETWRNFYVKMLYYIQKLNNLEIPYFPYRKYDPYIFYTRYANTYKKFNMIMIYAAHANRIDIFKSMIKKGATAFNRSLRVFVKKGDMENVNYMIQKGARMYNSALITAAKYNRLEMAKLFIEKGATEYDIALTKSIKSGHINTVKFLSDKFECNYSEKILIAVKSKRLDIVKILYEKSDKNIEIIPSLYESIKVGDLEIVKYLLQYEKNLDVKVCSMIAIKNKHVHIMNYFIDNGYHNYNEMLRFAASGARLYIVKDLISRGATDFKSALISACCSGKMKSVRFFSNKTDDYKDAIYYASQNENYKCRKYLISKRKRLACKNTENFFS